MSLMRSINIIALSAYGIYSGTSSPGGIIAYSHFQMLNRWLADDAQMLTNLYTN